MALQEEKRVLAEARLSLTQQPTGRSLLRTGAAGLQPAGLEDLCPPAPRLKNEAGVSDSDVSGLTDLTRLERHPAAVPSMGSGLQSGVVQSPLPGEKGKLPVAGGTDRRLLISYLEACRAAGLQHRSENKGQQGRGAGRGGRRVSGVHDAGAGPAALKRGREHSHLGWPHRTAPLVTPGSGRREVQALIS